MKVIKKEEHQVTRTFTYDIHEQDIRETFGTVERFREIVSHQTSGWDNEPVGEEPSDEEYDLFFEFFDNYYHELEDDWWSDRKGSYETSYELGEE